MEEESKTFIYLYLILFIVVVVVPVFPGVQLHTAPANDRNIIDPLIRSFQRDYIISSVHFSQ